MKNTSFAVAIDGPSASGKSTAAKLIAKRMQMIYIDTGAMYRAIALHNIRKGSDVADPETVQLSLSEIDIQIIHNESGQRLLLNGEDVTEALRTQAVAEGASVVSEYASVREFLLEAQRKLAQKDAVVMDGRDIGSFVLPWAQVKVYMDADLGERVNRRVNELTLKGETCDIDTVRNEIMKRDHRDKTREIAPLIQAEDAVYIDTSDLTAEQVADQVITLIKKYDL